MMYFKKAQRKRGRPSRREGGREGGRDLVVTREPGKELSSVLDLVLGLILKPPRPIGNHADLEREGGRERGEEKKKSVCAAFVFLETF